ncbi:uncharacterized [Tachysurus ichikawai]
MHLLFIRHGGGQAERGWRQVDGWLIEKGEVKSPTLCLVSPEALYFRRGPPFVPEAALSCSWMCFSEHRKPRLS